VHVAATGLGDQLLDEGLKGLRLRLGRRDRTVLDELGGQVRQDQLLVGRATTQTGGPSLGWGDCVSYGM
jgi:hypothetical protein